MFVFVATQEMWKESEKSVVYNFLKGKEYSWFIMAMQK